MPTQSGIAAGYSDFWPVGDDDGCADVAREASISLNDLYRWSGAWNMGIYLFYTAWGDLSITPC